jgi:mono/diheme cytochrome c family protein
MATYLVGSRPSASSAVTSSVPAALASAPPAAGRQAYVQLCSACHGVDGEGIAHVAPPMRTNARLRLSSPRNLLVAAGGLPARPLPGGERGHELASILLSFLAAGHKGL